MHRTMVFIDYENFEISRKSLYTRSDSGITENRQVPWLDIARLPKELISLLAPNYFLVKTFLFIPEPDEFLMKAEWRKKNYDFLKGLGNTDFFSVVPGRHVARPRILGQEMEVNKSDTYFIDEKGSDVNIAVQMIVKAFHNSYDTAIVLSGDTDYIPIYDVLDSIGKTVIVVGIKGQNLSRFKSHTDKQITLDLEFLRKCERQDRRLTN
ncbi:MAG: NYN domain-containing protein [Coriobacteriales bacterium]|nr:NYN domain-containing protein [Coriobacteriales bacterium]